MEEDPEVITHSDQIDTGDTGRPRKVKYAFNPPPLQKADTDKPIYGF